MSPLDHLVSTFTANSGVAHGPLSWEEAAEATVAVALERAAGALVAVSSGDPVIERGEIVGRLRKAGAEVLLPSDPAWGERLPVAGVGITGSVLGVAATGTVAVACGVDRPRGTSLVPPAHVCLVRTSDVVEDLDEALGLLSSLPSALAWISGPSRSADLGMTLTLGVHGPAAVDLIIVEDVASGRRDLPRPRD